MPASEYGKGHDTRAYNVKKRDRRYNMINFSADEKKPRINSKKRDHKKDRRKGKINMRDYT